MAKPMVLDSKTHQRTRVITSRGGEFGESTHLLPVIASELQSLVHDYPVCLIKDPDTGQFGLSVLLGFEPGENLFLTGDQWDASYIPVHVRRQPFMVGFATPDSGGQSQGRAVITIDMDSKRVQETEGEPLFEKDGSNTPYLEGINKLLAELMSGIETTKAFVDTLVKHDLIEPAQFNITFADGEQKRYEGMYTVKDDKLAELRGEALEELHGSGYLQAAHLMLASLGQVSKLIARSNLRRSAG